MTIDHRFKALKVTCKVYFIPSSPPPAVAEVEIVAVASVLIVVAVVSVLIAVAGSTSVAADAFEVVVAAVALAVASVAVVAVTESLDYSSVVVVAVVGETGDCPEPEADMSRQCTQVVLLPISLLRKD